MAKYTPDDDCRAVANAASGERLTSDEIDAAFQRVFDYREKLRADGNITDMADNLRKFAEQEAERTRIAAALARRHAALNILVRDRLDQTISSFMSAGLTPKQAMLAVLEGTQKGVEGGRNSVAALNLAYEARYFGGLFAELQANRPHLIKALRDPRLDADITREMAELREGGKPGITGNDDAKYVASVFSAYAEMSRVDLNKLGASVGKLDGWAGAQTHDDLKMIAAGKDAWIAAVAPKLDIERTFPDIVSAKDLEEALGGIYDTLITGMPNKPTPREKGQRVNPANLAKSLGKSRVLHFKDAGAALSYRAEFGHGNTVSGMISHLRSAAKTAANMEALGPNPEIMFGSIVDGLKRQIKEDPKLSPEQKVKAMKGLQVDAGSLRQALDVSTGMVSRPVNVTMAKIGADLRALQSMAKLGGAVISSMSDTVTAAAASQFRGSGFINGFIKQIGGLGKGRPKGEAAELSFLAGEGFDGLIGHIVSGAETQDGPVGSLAALQEKYFKLNGLTWWTDVQRATAGRVISAEMGMRAKVAYDALPPNYRHVLGLHGIDAGKWDVIRAAGVREFEGQSYVTADSIRGLDDEAFEPLGADRLAATEKGSAEGLAERRTSIIDDARRDMELSVLRFFADETSYGIVETDAASRRFMTQGLRPGTAAGEAIRFIGQFKGFPTAFTQRVLGRAAYGYRKGAGKDQAAHIGSLIAGLTVAGYASMIVKDALKGNWPPRDPFDPKTMLAALAQGGAAGLYGDYLFGQTNRFGGGVLQSIAGPTIGSATSMVELGLKYRDAAIAGVGGEEAKAPLGDMLDVALNTTPFANLFYTRPALDYLFLSSLREAVAPGYLKRQTDNRKRDYGQTQARPLGKPRDPLNLTRSF